MAVFTFLQSKGYRDFYGVRAYVLDRVEVRYAKSSLQSLLEHLIVDPSLEN